LVLKPGAHGANNRPQDHGECQKKTRCTKLGQHFQITVLGLILGPVIGAMRAWFKNQTDGRVFLFIAPVVSWLVSFISLYSLSDRRNLIVLATMLGLLIFSSNRIKITHEEQFDPKHNESV
jgi:hypothetical protein